MSHIKLDEKLMIAKLTDKIKSCKTNNKIVSTEFLNIYKRELLQKELNRLKEKNYLFFGGFEDSEYKILIVYPEKFKEEFHLYINNCNSQIAENAINNIIKAIRIKLPKELIGKYEHRDYLSAVMKFGLVRERMGDIIVHEDGAYIIVLAENAEYIKNSLEELIRFRKSKIEIIDIDKIELKPIEFKEIKISISSNRLDNFVSEICKISRSQTEELLKNEKIYQNSKLETKASKEVKSEDILVIRGRGKFKIGEKLGTNKKGKTIINILKYV